MISFFIWKHGRDNLIKFIDRAKSFHPSIKFTAEYSKTDINFLDTIVKKGPTGKLYTDLYVKPTDKSNYLHFSSAHPPHCKKSLSYSQFLRINKICTKDEDFERNSEDKSKHFQRRGSLQT